MVPWTGAAADARRTLGPVSQYRPLDDDGLLDGVETLAARDSDLAAVVDRHGPPPLWAREPGLPTLVRIVLEQQVSLASGRAAYERLEATLGAVTAEGLAGTDDAGLASAGLTRQKRRHLIGIGTAVEDGQLDLDRLGTLPDDEVRAALCAIPGIGPWTADVYLLMALGRRDAWPASDIALAASAMAVKRLVARPSARVLATLAEGWRPWRAVAARILWHEYLSSRHPARPRNAA